MSKKKSKSPSSPVIDDLREKYKNDTAKRKGTVEAIARRRADVWEMMCQGISRTEMANILGVHRHTIIGDVKYWKKRMARRAARIKEEPDAANVELGMNIGKLDTLAEAAFQEYTQAKTGCLTADSRVWLSDDVRAIVDVGASDSAVLHVNGEATVASVVRLIPNGERQVYVLRTRHREIRATANHPFLVVRPNGSEEWMKLGDLRIGDQLKIATALPTSAEPPRLLPLLDAEQERSFVRLTAAGRDALDSRQDVWRRNGYRGNFLRKHGLSILWNHIRSGRCGIKFAVMRDLFDGLGLSVEGHYYEFTGRRGGKQSTITLPERVTPAFCRLYGFWLADGWITESAKGATLIANPGHDYTLALYYLGLMRELNASAYIRETDGCFNIYSTSAVLAGVFRRLGWRDGARQKRLPAWIWGMPDEYKEELLAGFVDGDGCVRQTKAAHAEITTIELCNHALVRDLKTLVDGLGYSCGHIRFRDRRTASLSPAGRRIIGGPTYSISFTRNRLTRPFAVERVMSIEADGVEPVFDLEIDDDAHNFVADGFVVHNSEKDKFLNTTGKMIATKVRILQEAGYLPKAGVEVKTKVEHQVSFSERFGEDSPLSELDNATSRHKILSFAQRLIEAASQGHAIDVEGKVIESTGGEPPQLPLMPDGGSSAEAAG